MRRRFSAVSLNLVPRAFSAFRGAILKIVAEKFTVAFLDFCLNETRQSWENFLLLKKQ